LKSITLTVAGNHHHRLLNQKAAENNMH